ncbi:ArdC family protein [Solirhodobacter olei]|uniref:ArdC family protein n=1 Tax=Solirhodobacter olei TaxID=2493082 RepID=UPI000FDAD335|nr:zincin-like metallopeptidase domain-containing protein [Solirhodobacter olei]
MADKFDVYSHVTSEIVAAMEAGTPPWRQPWTGTTGGAAFPLRSNGEAYRGINVVLLWLTAASRGYSSAHWFTFKQALDMGAHVRKGEKSATVVKYGTFEKEDEAGETRAVPYAKAYRVFNADQIDGLHEEYHGVKGVAPQDFGTEPNAELDAFFAATGATIETTEEPSAYYHPVRDIIHMPPIVTFADAGRYYATLAHEGCHWTGHKSRLDRLELNRDRQTYAFEELVAEIGACMVCATLGLVPDFAQSAAYVEGWLNALKADARLIFKAASEAQKALDYLTGKARPEEQRAAA